MIIDKAQALRTVVDTVKRISKEAKIQRDDVEAFVRYGCAINIILEKASKDFDDVFVMRAIYFAHKELGFAPGPLDAKWVMLLQKNGFKINVKKCASYNKN